eukprot:jgi/Bigna1/72765/fgenesh1_pg.21_\
MSGVILATCCAVLACGRVAPFVHRASVGVRVPSRPSRGIQSFARNRSKSVHKCALDRRGTTLSPRVGEETVIIGPKGVEEVKIGDTVSLDYVIRSNDGTEMQSSKNTGPMTFEAGVGQSVANPLFQGIDQQVLGLKVGDAKQLNISGPEWNSDLLFKVPADHPEIERLGRRYSSQGGLREGEYDDKFLDDTKYLFPPLMLYTYMLFWWSLFYGFRCTLPLNRYVELVNGDTALVVKMDEDAVTLDCNSAFAGNAVMVDFQVKSIEQGDGAPNAYRPPEAV